jgi:hypothetical protein
MKKIFIIIVLLVAIMQVQAQNKTAIKTNLLLLPISVWNVQAEHLVSPKWSIVGSYYGGKFTFISETQVRGAHLLARRYFGKNNDILGFYTALGVSAHGDYNNVANKFNMGIGPRGGFGFQTHYKRLIMDTNIGGSIHMSNETLIDSTGTPFKNFSVNGLPGVALSIGYIF